MASADETGEFVCPVTGRSWETRPEWVVEGPRSTYRFYVLERRIVMCRSFGSTGREEVERYCQTIQSIIDEFHVPGKPLVLLEDYAQLHDSDNPGRQAYVAFHLARQDIWKGIVFFGMNPLLKLFFRLTRRLYPLRMTVEIQGGYAQAIHRAFQMLDLSLEIVPVADGSQVCSWSSPDLTVEFHPLDRDNVLRIVPRGCMRNRDVEAVFRAYETFLAAQSPPPGQWYRFVDYSALVDWDFGALLHTIRAFRRLDVLFPPRMRFIVNLPSGLGAFIGAVIATWTSRTQILRRRGDLSRQLAWIQEQDQRARSRCGLCERIRNPLGRGRDRIARDLMSFISELQWDVVGVPRNPYDTSDPLHQVAASLLVVKTDFDALFVERDRRERELDAARRRAEEVNRLQARFLANVSHEIRTPLNAVLGMGDLLADTGLDPRQDDLLRTLRQSAQGLLAVINDILDLSRMEAGEFHLVSEPFRLERVLDEVGSMIGYLASTKGIDFRLEREGTLPDGIRGDAVRLRQILVNLAGNAVKFTDDGAVVLRVRGEEGSGRTASRIAFEVEDSGPGIPPGKAEELFRPFKQLDGSFTRRHGGTGLGLAIARNLAERMGGGIAVHPAPVRGTVFRFEAPFVHADPPAHSEGSAEGEDVRLEGCILLAEDNPVNRKVALGFLAKLGLEAVAVDNGRDAIDALLRHPGMFRCVLMDIQMPVMDGMEAVRRIRQGEAGESSRGIPIYALTAHAMDGDRETFLAAGMDGYLSKPMRFASLRTTLESVLRSGWSSLSRPAELPGG